MIWIREYQGPVPLADVGHRDRGCQWAGEKPAAWLPSTVTTVQIVWLGLWARSWPSRAPSGLTGSLALAGRWPRTGHRGTVTALPVAGPGRLSVCEPAASPGARPRGHGELLKLLRSLEGTGNCSSCYEYHDSRVSSWPPPPWQRHHWQAVRVRPGRAAAAAATRHDASCWRTVTVGGPPAPGLGWRRPRRGRWAEIVSHPGLGWQPREVSRDSLPVCQRDWALNRHLTPRTIIGSGEPGGAARPGRPTATSSRQPRCAVGADLDSDIFVPVTATGLESMRPWPTVLRHNLKRCVNSMPPKASQLPARGREVNGYSHGMFCWCHCGCFRVRPPWPGGSGPGAEMRSMWVWILKGHREICFYCSPSSWSQLTNIMCCLACRDP